MDSSSDLGGPATATARVRVSDRLRAAAADLVLWLHHQAERFDQVPPEFGEGVSVDPNDAGSVAREWLRQARIWAGYNPEEVLALKAGAVALGGMLLVLIILIGAIR